jgi:hypothetical protein
MAGEATASTLSNAITTEPRHLFIRTSLASF